MLRALAGRAGYELVPREEAQRLRSRIERPASGTWVLKELPSGTRIWLDLGDLGVSAGVLRESWEKPETDFILSRLKPGDLFVDIGANIGWFALLAARLVGPGGKVFAFEPRATTFAYLERSIRENGFEHVVAYNCALGEAPGTLKIAWAPDAGNDGGTWLLAQPGLDEDLRRQGHAFQETAVRTLDEVLGEQKVDLIKLDIEGAELLALRGARALIERHRPTVVTEVNPSLLRIVSGAPVERLLGFFADLGYAAFEISAAGLGDPVDLERLAQAEVVNVAFLPGQAR